MSKRFRWFLFITGILIISVWLTATMFVYAYEDSLKKSITEKLNQYFKTKITYKKAEVSFYTNFPRLSLTLYDAEMQSANPKNKERILKAEEIYFSISLTDLLNRKYSVDNITVANAEILLYTDAQAQGNFDGSLLLLTAKKEIPQVSVTPKTIQFLKTAFTYRNKLNKEEFYCSLEKTTLNIDGSIEKAKMSLDAQLKNFSLQFNNKEFLQFRNIHLNSKNLSYNKQENALQIEDLLVKIEESAFKVKGKYTFVDWNSAKADLQFQGNQNDFKSIITFLPDEIYDRLVDYKTEGILDFKGTAKGEWSKSDFPHIDINFQCKDIALRSPNIKQAIQKLSFVGKFDNGAQNSLSSSSLTVQELKGELAGQKFRGGFKLSNFNQPYIATQIEASLDLAAFQEFYPLANIESLSGLLGIAINIEGEIAALRNPNEDNKVKISGEAELKKLNCKPKNKSFQIQNINMLLNFSDNITLIKNASGKIGKTDFDITNGKFIDLLGYLFLSNVRLKMEAKINAKKIQLDELLSRKDNSYFLHIPSNLMFALDVKSDSLIFNTFRVTDFITAFQLSDQIIKNSTTTFKMAGGTVKMTGILNTQREDFMRFDGRIFGNQLQTPIVWSMLNNFGQNFIEARHLNALLQLDMEIGFVFNKYLQVQVPHLVVAAGFTLNNGTFKQLEAYNRINGIMKNKNIVLDNAGNFSECKGVLQIRNNTIFIPEFEMAFAKHRLSLIGRSSLNQSIDYRLRIPTSNTNFYIALRGNLEAFTTKFADFANAKELNEVWEKERKNLKALFNKNTSKPI
ncbi:MAG: hypothetical protein EAZ55_02145 [Cytophagales bacterium]|nr:MAG: hypothetical protein EAZ55_02145 [Cytophagales bacterium]